MPTSVYQAYRQLFDVELVVTGSGREGAESKNDTKGMWKAIKRDAARYIFSFVSEAATCHRARGHTLRVAITWGTAMHEILDALFDVPINFSEFEKHRSTGEATLTPIASDEFLSPGNIITMPMVGMMASTFQDVEANDHARRFIKLFGGSAISVPHYAYYDPQANQADKINKRFKEDWDKLDVAIFGCDKVKEFFGSKAEAPVPAVLYEQMRLAAVCESGGIYLNDSGSEVRPTDFRRVGISFEQLQQVKQRGGAILIAGIQSERVKPVAAVLRGGLVSTLVTNLDFARKVLHAHAESLDRPH